MKVLLPFVFLLIIFGSCQTEGTTYDPRWSAEDKNELLSGLQQSSDSLESIVKQVDPKYFFTKPDSNSWSIAEVVEHLVLQDQAYYRELTAISVRPEEVNFIEDLRENDEKFREYATDPNPGQADWFAVPTGNYKDFKVVLNQFKKVRISTIEFINKTESDLRRHYTYRSIPEQLLTNDFYRVRKVRDLHQLVLNEIAHTYRHIGQVLRIKESLGLQ